jgi:hypothetical protein
MIDGFLALYIFMLAAFTGKEIIGRVPVILHTPLMSGSNFVHGIVLVGAMIGLSHAESPLAIAINPSSAPSWAALSTITPPSTARHPAVSRPPAPASRPLKAACPSRSPGAVRSAPHTATVPARA